MAAYNAVIHVRYVGRGPAGETMMEGATRVRVPFNLNAKRQRAGGDELPQNVHVTGGAPQVIVETENFGDIVTLFGVLNTEEVLVIGYKTAGAGMGAGNRTLTIKQAKVTAIGESEFPPAEDGPQVPRYQVTFDVVKGEEDTVLTLATAIVDDAEA